MFFLSGFFQDFLIIFAFFFEFEYNILRYRFLDICLAWFSLSFLHLVWCLSLISENSRPLLLKIFLSLHSLSPLLWYSNYVYVTSFEIIPRFLDILLWVFYFSILFFPLCISIWEFSIVISSDSLIRPLGLGPVY